MGMSCKKRPIHQVLLSKEMAVCKKKKKRKRKRKRKKPQQNQQQQKTTSFYCESNTASGVSKKRLL